MEEKRIIIEQTSESQPIQIDMIGPWKAKEISRIQRQLVLAYRRNRAVIRKAFEAEQKAKKEE